LFRFLMECAVIRIGIPSSMDVRFQDISIEF
jgi:hypothetical protein